MKKGPGSAARVTKDELEYAKSCLGKVKLCKCPLHRNNGKGVELPKEKFKMQRSAKDGSQHMCYDGKTLIDSYSHMLNRLQLLAIVDIKEVKDILDNADNIFIGITKKIKSIICEVLRMPNKDKLSEKEFKLFLLTQLDKKLRTKKTGFYDVDLKPKDKFRFNEHLKSSFTIQRLTKMEIEQDKWTQGGYVRDSKDGKLYPVENFIFNVSKKREYYAVNEKSTPYRINVHNTLAKGQRGSTMRAEKYLASGDYREANETMKILGNKNKNIHADHIIPLALGGIHDKKNLVALGGKENIYKKDKLTLEAFNLLKSDHSYLSDWLHEIFKANKNQSIEYVWAILKNSVQEKREQVKNMPDNDKFKHISNFYPHYKESQIKRIIKKHFTEYED